VGCYNCHLGPGNDDANPNRAAVAQNATATTRVNTAVTLPLSATDPNKNSLVIRIVSQPQHGTVAFNGKQATYYPDAGFVGTDSFTFAAWDGSTDSNLGSGSIKVNAAAALAATLGAPVAGDTATGIVIAMRQGHVVVSWPSGMGVVTLEAADEPLPDADWVTVPGTPQTDGVRDYLEVEAPAGARFFRARLH